MADYTKLTQKIVKKLLAQYDLGEFESMATLAGGQANSSVKIKTRTGVFTLSVCDEKNQKQIQCLTRVLAYLETHKFPTTPLVLTRNNKPFINHGGKPVYIKRFLPGQVCSKLSPDMHFQVGGAMAKLHALAPPEDLPKEFPYGLTAFEEIQTTDISHPYVDWLKEKTTFLETAIDPSMKKGFIHGDIFWDNLLFSSVTLVALLDFEEACSYYKLFDIGMCAVGCCTRNGLFDLNQVNMLAAGYQKVSPLADVERKQLKIFMEYAAVTASFWRFRQYNIRYPSPDKKDNYRELSLLADQVHAMDEHQFKLIWAK